MLFSCLSTLTVVPNCAAMPLSVSPDLTVYWRVPLGAGVAGGRGVVEGATDVAVGATDAEGASVGAGAAV
jgi:hypothetical protein